MVLKGNVEIRAPRKQEWDFHTDPNLIAQCGPGVKQAEIIEEKIKYYGEVPVGLGSVKARFSEGVAIRKLDEPNHAKRKTLDTANASISREAGC